eukprot:CAMPEP_0170061150 /NCGR_PEP_ID=MMETSP0019_2-20121128/2827_1 /TAXON_ID=98059 /ORGANISM="Dinobryon sp., Strain UTEXLB2267" /LENGTH=2072 /DNA_ID=CAMNT_0010266911 /DNA_START=9 /DNA_END=6227 /DNA_ORIENTATION=+
MSTRARSSSVSSVAKKIATISEFVERMGGKRIIQRVLIANNGMAATKAILSLRQWAYMVLGDERMIEFVAMATRDDLNANAEFIRLADTFVEVPCGSNKNNYANVSLIVSIAVEQKVDAVWPGWGHASENPLLPTSLKEKGIQFIGPTAPVMAALGDKVSANILAQTANVPSIPWSGEGITSALNEEGVIPQDIFNKACLFSVEEASKMADKIGYPVMLKASEGGGGKGIRMVKHAEDLRTNFIQVQNEVPGSPIFMMQLCTEARHLEVQIVGDEYGNALALNGRDCSTQRRFQKIFEEGPPVIAPKEVFRQMELSAQRLTQSIGYIGAGTIEYLFNAATNKYFFLELNPRLQVEHPVTEGITGVNLPSVQLQVAMGIALYRIPEIREFFGENPISAEPIDFMKQEYRYPTNHVIAARITAENPDEGFKPTSGKIERVKFQSTNKVWGYFSVGANGGIHEFADSQFGHLFASGRTREEARKALVLALKEIDVRGDIRTTVEYLIKLLETKEFKDNTIDTSWLDGLIREKSISVLVDPQTVALSAAVYKAHSHVLTHTKDFIESLSKGQTSLQSLPSMLSFPVEVTYDSVKYSFAAKLMGPNYFLLRINGQTISARIREQPDKSLLCNISGNSFQLFGHVEPLGLRMKINGATVMIPTVYNPSELRSDVTGKIVRFLQQDRDFVEKDEPYVEVEAMKMIMAFKATESGVIRHNLSPGSIISAGDLVASLTLKDPTKVKQISTFSDRLQSVPAAPSLTGAEAAEAIRLALDGYEQEAEVALTTFFEVSSLEVTEAFIIEQMQKFVDSEGGFVGGDEALVVGNLVKANKDNLAAVIPILLARKKLKSRISIIMSLLRQLQFFPQLYSDYSFVNESTGSKLQAVFTALAGLDGSVYGPIALKAKQMLESTLTLPFQTRLQTLKETILAGHIDTTSLSVEPSTFINANLLLLLMYDGNELIRRVAMELYIRRVYRSFSVKNMTIEADDLAVQWTFSLRDTVDCSNLPIRNGYMILLPSLETMKETLPIAMSRAARVLNKSSGFSEPLNVIHIGVCQRNAPQSQVHSHYQTNFAALNDVQEQVCSSLKLHKDQLAAMDIRMASVMIVDPSESANGHVCYFNYSSELQFAEDPVSRNMHPTWPQLLEIHRLTENHDLLKLPTIGRNAQLYLGHEKVAGAGKKTVSDHQVLFWRAISLTPDAVTTAGADKAISMALDELERAALDPRVSDTSSSRLFVNIIPDIDIGLHRCVDHFKHIMDSLMSKYATQLVKLRVDEIEIKMRVKDDSDANNIVGFVPVRLIASSSTGGWLTREAYKEYLDPVTGQTQRYCNLVGDESSSVLDPYPTSNALQKKRSAARRVGSTYATDFLGLIEVAVINSWQRYFDDCNASNMTPPPSLFVFDELVLASDGELVRTKRFPGQNRIGMLAWHTTLKTPQYPTGRDVVFIANDVTVQSGSFGVQEDEFFFKASEYARVRGLPRVFISCNSGARIGLVDELKPKFKVAWKDEANPSLGFDYLYLSQEDYLAMPAGTVDATATVTASGETRYLLDAIIGLGNGIGVENLRGSGLIAGETSRAYDETFTLSYVTGRSVGIGAYLNRLGQRVIQMQQGPMILTGFSALNKLLGKEVYTSQDQLGGPQIMYPNGVTHEVVLDDREGMQSVVDWLSYTPKDFLSTSPPLLHSELMDPPERPIDFLPSKTPYDPRHMLAGLSQPDGSFVSGFCDKGSFKEYLGGWGKSVVTGRARLGGINVGVIAVETRLVEQRIPADPGNPESREAIQPQAGQVWYPDSAYKTAQVIQDFNRGENLPLIIFANWRGFSGGTRDMYGEILKYGAMIVDSLRTYRHPVFVYIPPGGELRGGAWVVIDPTINPVKMEMFADQEARGGILEPPGICEVKFRQPEQLLAMHRLDPQLQELDRAGSAASDEQEKGRIAADIKGREKSLSPLYMQIAHEFADLHDRAGRMKAKGCISEVLQWRSARGFFYWRILRRQKEDALLARLVAASEHSLSHALAKQKLAEVVPAAVSSGGDKELLAWLESHDEELEQLVARVRSEQSVKTAAALLKGLSPEERAQLSDFL